MRQKVMFESQGIALSGLLEIPAGKVKAFALFAHCFTCGKDIAAASRISRALVQQSFAVFRFDFTGLGNSDGDFSNSNFSSNLDDLLAAANYLRAEYLAPELIIGHSLGGTAALMMANKVEECKAVVTISAPASAEHVKHNFAASVNTIEKEGLARVKLGLREFTIKKQFLEDIAYYNKSLFKLDKKALLVMHSPLDETVAIDEAETIYQWAKHPKSFVSLDQADHLLSNKADSEYVANTIAGWSSKYITSTNTSNRLKFAERGSVIVEEKDHKFTQHVISDSHYWLADEPTDVGGKNVGPNPYEHLLAALGSCTAMTMRLYATKKALPVENIKVTLKHYRNYQEDCQSCTTKSSYVERIDRNIELQGDLSGEQRERLIEIANKCPVHKTLNSKILVKTNLQENPY